MLIFVYHMRRHLSLYTWTNFSSFWMLNIIAVSCNICNILIVKYWKLILKKEKIAQRQDHLLFILSQSQNFWPHTRCSLHPGTRLRFVMRSEFLTRMTRVSLPWEKLRKWRQWYYYQWNKDGKRFPYDEKNDKHEDNDIASEEITMTRVYYIEKNYEW